MVIYKHSGVRSVLVAVMLLAMGKEGYGDIDGMVEEGVVMVVLKRGAVDPGMVVDVGLLEVQEEMVLGQGPKRQWR